MEWDYYAGVNCIAITLLNRSLFSCSIVSDTCRNQLLVTCYILTRFPSTLKSMYLHL